MIKINLGFPSLPVDGRWHHYLPIFEQVIEKLYIGYTDLLGYSHLFWGVNTYLENSVMYYVLECCIRV